VGPIKKKLPQDFCFPFSVLSIVQKIEICPLHILYMTNLKKPDQGRAFCVKTMSSTQFTSASFCAGFPPGMKTWALTSSTII
jgi:hypothetical protein